MDSKLCWEIGINGPPLKATNPVRCRRNLTNQSCSLSYFSYFEEQQVEGMFTCYHETSCILASIKTAKQDVLQRIITLNKYVQNFKFGFIATNYSYSDQVNNGNR